MKVYKCVLNFRKVLYMKAVAVKVHVYTFTFVIRCENNMWWSA